MINDALWELATAALMGYFNYNHSDVTTLYKALEAQLDPVLVARHAQGDFSEEVLAELAKADIIRDALFAHKRKGR